MIKTKQQGFTLIELLLVIAIIGILATIIIINVNSAREKAKIVKARMEVRQIYNAIIFLQDDTAEWPGHKEPYDIEDGSNGNEICPDGCTYDLTDCWAGLLCSDTYQNWQGPYWPSAISLTDSWGHQYFFDTDYDMDPTGAEKWAIVVGSYGPNGVGNNNYDTDNIIYILAE